MAPVRQRVPIRWGELELAVERNDAHAEYFLDCASGRVICVGGDLPEAALNHRYVAQNIETCLRVVPATSRQQYRWMVAFIDSVDNLQLQRELNAAIQGKGAFRRFKDAVAGYDLERERWFSYRADLLHLHIQGWLDENRIEGIQPPQWELPIRVAAAEPELRTRERIVSLAREMPAGELLAAEAYLEFLHQRDSARFAGLRLARAAVESRGAAPSGPVPGVPRIVSPGATSSADPVTEGGECAVQARPGEEPAPRPEFARGGTVDYLLK